MSQMELKLSTPDRRVLKNLATAVEKLTAELARSRPQQVPSQVKLDPETIRRLSEQYSEDWKDGYTTGMADAGKYMTEPELP